MKKLLIANWKSNPGTPREAAALARAIGRAARGTKRAEIVITPPFPFLPYVAKTRGAAQLGAQNLFWEEKGPYTGEVGAAQLKALGVSYVIIGHSERRRLLGETDEMIAKKVAAVIKAGITLVLCVGEPWAVRKRGLPAAEAFVGRQLKKDLSGVSRFMFRVSRLVVAYEPVWAISASGIGRADIPKEAAQMLTFIKEHFLNSKFEIRNSKFIYGGSVNSRNARGFLERPEIDGALVGGASLRPKEFRAIIRSAEK